MGKRVLVRLKRPRRRVLILVLVDLGGKDGEWDRYAIRWACAVLILVLVDLGGKGLFAEQVIYDYVLILVLVDLGGKAYRKPCNRFESKVLILVLVDLGGKVIIFSTMMLI